MSTDATITPFLHDPEYKAKRRLVSFDVAPNSQLPHLVIKKKTGVVLGRFADADECSKFLNSYPLSHLESKPTCRRSR